MSPEQGGTSRFVTNVLDYADDLIHLSLAASAPYARFVFGSEADAERADRILLDAGCAEFGPPFAHLLIEDNRPVGVLAILQGEELVRVRLQAAMTLRRLGILSPGSALESSTRAAAASLRRIESADLYLSRLAVSPEMRGRGLGRKLLSELMRLATERGHRKIVLEVAAENPAAIRFYQSGGFVREDTAIVQWCERRLEYVHMSRPVDGT